MIKYLSLFSGVGSPEMALRNLGIEFELVGFSEVDKYAIKSYCAIHGVDESLNLGDITKIDIDALPDDIDLITHGSPCQDFSFAGKRQGGDEGSGTRSSLMWNTVEIIRKKKPKCVIWENVKGAISKKHIHNFEKYLQSMSNEGYKNYYKVLNAKHYGVPQNRERIFVISILGEHNPYIFPEGQETRKSIRDILEDHVDEKFYLSDEIQRRFKFIDNNKNIIGTTKPDFRSIGQRDNVYNIDGTIGSLTATDYKQPKQIAEINKIGEIEGINFDQDRRVYATNGLSPTLSTGSGHAPKLLIPQNTKKGYIELELPGMCDLSYMSSITRRGRVQEGGKVSPAVTTAAHNICYVDQYRIRKITPLEAWRLMGFSDSDYNKAAEVCSNTQLYKQAGNSIVVNVMEAIFKNIYDK